MKNPKLVAFALGVALCHAHSVRGEAFAVSPVPLTRGVIYAADNPPPTPRLEDLPLVDSITFPDPGCPFAITWKFDHKVRIGRFVNNDIYVVGPVTVVDIEPKPLFGDEVPQDDIVSKERFPNHFVEIAEKPRFAGKYARNGSELNKEPNAKPGVDSRICYGYYDWTKFRKPPISLKPGDMLLSSVSKPTKELQRYDVHQPVVKFMAALTCVDKPLPPDAFRPSYCDRKQTIYYARNIRRDLLYNLPKPPDAPRIEDYIRKFQLPWMDTLAFNVDAPEENCPMYGQYYSETVSAVSMMLQMDYPPEKKEALLCNYLQYGIDLIGIVRAGKTNWSVLGGYGDGRKWTIIFTGIMLGDDEMAHFSRHYPHIRFGEDAKTAYGKSWMGYDVVFTSHPLEFKTSPELIDPSKWTSRSGHANGWMNEGYRICCTSRAWVGEALAMRLMRVQPLWNHDAFFDYVDRWMTEDKVRQGEIMAGTWKYRAAAFAKSREKDSSGALLSKPLSTQEEAAETAKTIKQYQALSKHLTDKFIQEMWNKYRHNLPPPKEGDYWLTQPDR